MKKILFSVCLLIGLVVSVSAFAYSTFGPTKSGDTLWGIASKNKPVDVNMKSMISAIQRLNPQAFKGQHDNILKVGVQLMLPATENEVQTALHDDIPATSTSESLASVQHEVGVVNADQNHWQQIAAGMQQAKNRLQNQLMLAQQKLTKAGNQILFLQKQQGMPSSAVHTSNTVWSWIWFLVWAATLGFIFMRRKFNFSDIKEKFSQADSQGFVAPNEEVITTSELVSEKQVVAAQVGTQAEFDIPEVKVFDEAVLSEQAQQRKELLEEIAEDSDNFDLHQNILSFYIGHDEQDAFDEHLKQMVTDKVVKEGDAHWNRLRTMYLNQWIYDRN